MRMSEDNYQETLSLFLELNQAHISQDLCQEAQLLLKLSNAYYSQNSFEKALDCCNRGLIIGEHPILEKRGNLFAIKTRE
ncbi:MAG: hypothetical protein F6K47_00275 [Symploca sp. SIO2E6]|nr:hypothetical protein [Symploca sp. SIO2E6]